MAREESQGIAKIILLCDPDCLVQSHIPLKVSPVFPSANDHMGREGVLYDFQTLLRAVSREDTRTKSSLGYRLPV